MAEFAKLPVSDIYLLGEVHDNALHHERQAELTRLIQPAALVFEMLSPEQAVGSVGIDRSDLNALETSLNWNVDGWGDFQLWYPIFLAAPDATIFGAAVPRIDVRRAILDGAEAVFGADAATFGLTNSLPVDQQIAREAAQDRAHCGALPSEMLSGMVEAQRLRDAAFARSALQALKDTGGPIVVISGNGHVRHWAIPAALRHADPAISVLSIGQVSQGVIDPPYDLWLVSSANQPSVDPCDTFESK